LFNNYLFVYKMDRDCGSAVGYKIINRECQSIFENLLRNSTTPFHSTSSIIQLRNKVQDLLHQLHSRGTIGSGLETDRG